MKINEDEVIKDLKHNFKIFKEEYKDIFKYYEEDNDKHLSWEYENAIVLSLISIQDIQANLEMLEYLWIKKSEKTKKEKINMKNNELSDDELFILLKGMIKQKETDKALKLANMVLIRFNDLLTEIDNLNDKIYWKKPFI